MVEVGKGSHHGYILEMRMTYWLRVDPLFFPSLIFLAQSSLLFPSLPFDQEFSNRVVVFGNMWGPFSAVHRA